MKKPITEKQARIWEESRIDYYGKEGYLDGHGLPVGWEIIVEKMGCVYYEGKVKYARAWNFHIGNCPGTFQVFSASLAKYLRQQAKEWQKRHSGPAFTERLWKAAAKVEKNFIPRGDYGANNKGVFYVYGMGKKMIKLYLTEQDYLLSEQGENLER